MKRVFIIAGDPSGDLIGAQLIEAMKKIEPDLEITGMGGKNLQKTSHRFLENIVEKHASGFAISPKKLMYFKNLLNEKIYQEFKNNPPDVVIPVDFYGFNSRMAAMAKKMGHQVFYYASPQFWASRPGRAEKLRDIVDIFLCLFPFELKFYESRKLPAKFVGHPILDSIPYLSPDDEKPLRIESIVGLLPGSRPDEVKRHLPVMARAAGIITHKFPGTRFVVFTVPHISRHLYQELLGTPQKNNALIELIQDENYQWRSQIDLAISASGMETLENALLGIPMVIMYKTHWITYAIARSIIKIRQIGMPNLLAGKEIVPERIQWEATPESISKPIINWLEKPQERHAVRKKLLSLRQLFGKNGASQRAAKTILDKVA